MPYTITHWEDRPEFGGPIFSATLKGEYYRVSAINYSYPAHDGDHGLHETIVWHNGEEVWFERDTHDAIRVFHDYLTSKGLYA